MTWEVAILGDLHGSWDDWDAHYFNASHYALLIFTGDLGSGTSYNGVEIARSIARLSKPALVMPGNNDAAFLPQIAAEFGHQKGLISLLQAMESERPGPLADASGQVSLCGFSVHDVDLGSLPFSLIAARPMAMGGGAFSFGDVVKRRHGVADMAASTRLLHELVTQARYERLVFLGHNGPLGLGGAPTDPWGCDFQPGAGDWGDPDLASAIHFAKDSGRQVAAVVAGHMHMRTRSGETRRMQAAHKGVPHCNAARVPRIVPGKDDVYRHHHVMRPDGHGGLEFVERAVPEGA